MGQYPLLIFHDYRITIYVTQQMDLPRMKAVAKVALIIANEEYEHHECLLTPKNDAARIGTLLKEIGFEVICLMNLTITQMKNTIKLFSKTLVEGVYGKT